MRGLMSFFYRLLKYKSFRVIRFSFYRNSNIKKNENSLLLTRLCYEGHHLEKAVKNQYSESRGKDRARRLEELIHEAKGRDTGQRHLIQWAEGILDAFKSKQERKEKMVEPRTDGETVSGNPDVLNAVLNRKSVRFWLPRVVEPPLIKKIVEAGLNGPLSCNRQAIRVGVVENEPHGMVFGTAANKSMLSKAPLVLYVAVDRRLYYEKYAPGLDAGSFCANALLAGEALGLGGCWMYGCETADQRMLRKQFHLSRSYYFYSALLIGYPAENAHKPPRKSAESVIV